MDKASKILDIVVLAYEGVDELDLFGAWSVLKKAEDMTPPVAAPVLRVRIASAFACVRGSGGVAFDVPARLDVISDARVVVVPGGRGARHAADDPAIHHALIGVIDRGGTLYGICTGSLIVAATGRTKESCLAIHRNKREALLDFPVNEVRSGLIRDGQFVTVGGDDSPSVKSVDLALTVLQDFAPYAVAPVSSRMEIVVGRKVSFSHAVALAAS